MKLIVCDIEGTIFKPHKIKSSQHASYIWTAIAEALGSEAEKEEINTQKKWRSGGYGTQYKGLEYTKWVEESVEIHIKYGLTEAKLRDLIDNAPYVDGVQYFFDNLNREEYIPIFISGGIQNLSERACRDLGVKLEDSYAACKYHFKSDGKIDKNLTLINTSNFHGKQEIVKIALKKYGFSKTDWIFIGDGINDLSVAKTAPLSIGIDPIPELRAVAKTSFSNFSELCESEFFIRKYNLFSTTKNLVNSNDATPIVTDYMMLNMEVLIKDAYKQVEDQVKYIDFNNLESKANERLRKLSDGRIPNDKTMFSGIKNLLSDGQLSFSLLAEATGKDEVSSAILQPFCNAVELMINIAIVLTTEKAEFNNLEKYFRYGNYSRRTMIDVIKNNDLRIVLIEYFQQRNKTAHTYQSIPIDAARSLIQRSYESIQRLELLINPIEFLSHQF